MRHPSPHYAERLRRRLGGAGILTILSVVITWAALGTVLGQGVDTMMMEALGWRLSFLARWESSARTMISVLGVALASVSIALIAFARRRPTLATRALALIIVSNGLTQILKWVLSRADLGLTYLLPNSLPSGHVAIAASVAVAVVMVAPDYVRSAAAWIGWAWTCGIGVLVMVLQWHRVSDVLVAIMIVGVCALVLAPIEVRERHLQLAQTVMVFFVALSLMAALLTLMSALIGLDVWGAAEVSSEGYGFITFLRQEPTRAALLAVSAVFSILGVSGFVMHEVNRLSGPLRSS